MEVVGEGKRLYIYICVCVDIPIASVTVTTRMTSALRWAAMRAIIMIDNCEGQSHKTVSTDHNI